LLGVDLVPDRIVRARSHGVDVLNLDEEDDLAGAVREKTGGRRPTAVIDAVGMEAHGSPVGALAHRLTGLLPDIAAQKLMMTAASTGSRRCIRRSSSSVAAAPCR